MWVFGRAVPLRLFLTTLGWGCGIRVLSFPRGAKIQRKPRQGRWGWGERECFWEEHPHPYLSPERQAFCEGWMGVLGTKSGGLEVTIGPEKVREVLWGLCLHSEVPSTQEHILKGKTLFGHVKARKRQERYAEMQREAEKGQVDRTLLEDSFPPRPASAPSQLLDAFPRVKVP